MSPEPIHPALDPVVAEFLSRLSSMGVMSIVIDAAGEPGGDIDCESLRASGFTVSGPEVAETLRLAAARWATEAQPTIWSPRGDLTLVPTTLSRRRRRTGYLVAFVAGASGLGEAMLLSRALPCLWSDHSELAESRLAVESFSRQLSGVYEELSLVYRLSGAMSSLTNPERFVTLALDELHATLPFDSISACFSEESSKGRSLAGRVVRVGEKAERKLDDAIARDALRELSMDSPTVFGRVDTGAGEMRGGGDCLAHPIVREETLIGAVVALRKHGEDPHVSSTDIKLVGAAAAAIGVLLENAALYADQRSMFLGTLRALTAAIDAKDRYTRGHSERVAYMAMKLGEAIGMEPESLERLHIAGLIHDVGKIGVPEAVLCKPGRLTDEEFELIKLHPEIGHRILRDIPQLVDVLPGVLYHHERWDGRGYPEGLSGEGIPLFARLIAIADSFDAMSSTRTYRSAMPRERALTEIARCGGTQFDPQLSRYFVEMDFAEYDRMVERHKAAEQRQVTIASVEGEAAA